MVEIENGNSVFDFEATVNFRIRHSVKATKNTIMPKVKDVGKEVYICC